MQTQRITDVIESDGMGELPIEEADQMAPGRKRPRFLIHLGLPRQLRHEVGRNQIANLQQHSKLAAAWNGCCVFFSSLPSGRVNQLFQAFLFTRYGMAVI